MSNFEVSQYTHDLIQKPTNNMRHRQKSNDDNTVATIEINYTNDTGKYIYMIFHIIMAITAVFLSWKCNNGNFDLLSFLVALIFPYVYIIYTFATRGICNK